MALWNKQFWTVHILNESVNLHPFIRGVWVIRAPIPSSLWGIHALPPLTHKRDLSGTVATIHFSPFTCCFCKFLRRSFTGSFRNENAEFTQSLLCSLFAVYPCNNKYYILNSIPKFWCIEKCGVIKLIPWRKLWCNICTLNLGPHALPFHECNFFAYNWITPGRPGQRLPTLVFHELFFVCNIFGLEVYYEGCPRVPSHKGNFYCHIAFAHVWTGARHNEAIKLPSPWKDLAFLPDVIWAWRGRTGQGWEGSPTNSAR